LREKSDETSKYELKILTKIRKGNKRKRGRRAKELKKGTHLWHPE